MNLSRAVIKVMGPQPWRPAQQLIEARLGRSTTRLLNNSHGGGGGVAGGPGGSDDGAPASDSLAIILDPDAGKSVYKGD